MNAFSVEKPRLKYENVSYAWFQFQFIMFKRKEKLRGKH